MESCEKSDSVMRKTLTEHEKRLKNLKNGAGGGTESGMNEESL